MQNINSALRFAFRAIYLTNDDSPEDRNVWWSATDSQRATAEREVRAEMRGSTDRLTKSEAGSALAALAW